MQILSGCFLLGQFYAFGSGCMRSLGQPVGSLAADLIGVSMITCKNDRLLELLWFVGYPENCGAGH